MFRRLLLLLVIVGVVGAAGFWLVTAPATRSTAALPAGDAAAGELVFHIGGCASCHAEPRSEGDARFLLGGGLELETPFGTFVAPNISSDPEWGIGGWSDADFANALQAGLSPDGRHYYPAFPFASYARMTGQDVADLWAFLQTVPPVDKPNEPHKLGFPFNIRRGIGLWKRLYLTDQPVLDLAGADANVLRGQYLAEGPGHCGECHTPRSAMGGMDTANWLSGAPNPEGQGRIPDLTPAGNLGGWSQNDIAEYLKSGFTPDFDTAGGAMVDVIRNSSQLPESDRQAIAAYLKALPE